MGGIGELGLDQLLLRLANDVVGPGKALLATLAYIMAIYYAIQGILRIIRKGEEGPRGPSGTNIMMCFVLCGVFVQLGGTMDAFANSLFAGGRASATATLAYTVGSQEMTQHVNNVMSALFGFVSLVGWAFFMKGWVILESVSNGNSQSSQTSGWIHIFGGVLAVNLTDFLAYLQGSLQINILNV